jgi:preprotein translocase subunit SecG
MDTIETLVLTVHVMAALAIIGLVLIQQGKGSDMGSGFGGGASSTVFGSGGAGGFLARATTTIAIGFFLTSFGLAFFAKERSIQVRDLGIPVVVEQAPAVEELPELRDDGGSEVPALEGSEIPEG